MVRPEAVNVPECASKKLRKCKRIVMKEEQSGNFEVSYRLDENNTISNILVFGKSEESVRRHLISIYETVDIISITRENKNDIHGKIDE